MHAREGLYALRSVLPEVSPSVSFEAVPVLVFSSCSCSSSLLLLFVCLLLFVGWLVVLAVILFFFSFNP